MSKTESGDPTPARRHPASETGGADRRPRALTSTELLQGSRIVEIRHNGAIYRLQATRLGKLILTK